MATSSGVTLTGDVTGSGTGSFAATLSNSGVTAGTYRSVTVDAKGRVTAGTNPTTLAGYGITDAVTSGGSGASGTWGISITGSAAQLGGVAAGNYFRVDGSYPNADMNVPVEGYWHVASSASNLPDGALFGHRWDYDHAGDGNWVAQFYTPTSGDAGLWFRQRRSGTWQAWRKIVDSSTVNSYAPTLTGGGASGTWGISVTGTANSETLNTVCSRGVNASGYGPTFDTVYTNNWFRSWGNSGWYNGTHGGGIWMTDSTYVRVYNNKQFYADAAITSGTALYAPIFYDSNDTAWYLDPNGTSRCNLFYGQSIVNFGTDFYVGEGTNYSNIRMRDADEGERVIHCNSNRIGFLNQSGGWGSWCNDDGSWSAYGGTAEALEAIGGWGVYGCTIEVRTDGNGTQDGPRVWHHKGAAKWWASGIQGGGSHGYAIWEDGGNTQWGTERLVIAPGGAIRHNSVPAFFVRAFVNFDAAATVTTYGNENVSSVTYRNGVGLFTINFTTAIPRPSGGASNRPAYFGSVGNGADTFTNTTMRFAGKFFASSGMTSINIAIVTSGGQGVPSASNAMNDCCFMVVST
jgi:hypothetical protein